MNTDKAVLNFDDTSPTFSYFYCINFEMTNFFLSYWKEKGRQTNVHWCLLVNLIDGSNRRAVYGIQLLLRKQILFSFIYICIYTDVRSRSDFSFLLMIDIYQYTHTHIYSQCCYSLILIKLTKEVKENVDMKVTERNIWWKQILKLYRHDNTLLLYMCVCLLLIMKFFFLSKYYIERERERGKKRN